MKTIGFAVGMLSWFWILSFGILSGQVPESEKAVLLGILEKNCFECPLEDSMNSWYWNVDGEVNSTNFPGVLVSGGHVTGLLLSNLRLQGTLDSLGQLEHFSQLAIAGNHITEIPDLSRLSNLTYLDIRSNAFHTLPEFGALTALTELRISSDSLETIEEFSFPDGLILLSAQGPAMNKIMSAIQKCHSLQDLSISSAGLDGDLDLSSFPDLVSVSMHENNLDSLLPVVLPKLETLQVFRNEISHFPPVTCFPKLKRVVLDNNNFESLPSFRETSSLRYISVNSNQLDYLPDLPACSANSGNGTGRIDIYCSYCPLNSLGSLQPCQVKTLRCISTELTFTQLEPFADDSLIQFMQVSTVDSIAITEKSAFLHLPGDPVVLDASRLGGTRGTYQWIRSGKQLLGKTQGNIPISEADSTGSYSCLIQHPDFPNSITTKSVHVQFDPGISQKDPNHDGRSNILDIVGVGTYYGEEGTARDRTSKYFNDDRQPAYDWLDAFDKPRTHVYNGDTLNIKHFDSNGDGRIDEADLEYFKAEMEQIDWSVENLHIDQKTLRIPLVAWPDTNEMTVDDNDYCEIRYQIKIGELDESMEGRKICGLIFVRPEVETAEDGFQIKTMWADFDHSEFVPDTNNQVKVDKFYGDSEINIAGFDTSDCIRNVVRPLEIAIFRKDSAFPIWSGQRVVDCLVGGTIDDLVPFGKVVPLLFETTNIILFEELESGNWQRYTGICTVDPDTVHITNNQRCNSTLTKAEVRRQSGSDQINFNYQLSEEGTIEILIKDKQGNEVETHQASAGSGTYQLNTKGMGRGKYTATFRSCNGAECQGKFAVKGRFCAFFYYLFCHRQPSCG